jgi:branched-subunit amino acid transport protein
MNPLFIIIGMAGVTYLTKALVLLAGERVRFSPAVRTALGFVPVTVLTAIISPMVLAPHHAGLELSWRNPQLVAATVAIVVSAWTRHMLLTIALALAVFFAWQYGLLH